MPSDATQPIREKLDRAESRLAAALGEVCDDTARGGVRRPNTGELIRIDQTLTLAAEAVKQAILLRRRLRRGAQERPADDGDRPRACSD